MDQRYFDFLADDLFYLESPKSEDEQYVVPIPAHWVATADDHWIHMMPPGTRLQEQGWKIHVSSRPDEAVACIRTVSRLLIEKQVTFKFVRSAMENLKKNSKHALRAASGKLMTVYPASTENFLELLTQLEHITLDYEPGPYILSDRRWRDSNVYYRYGAFLPLEFEQAGVKKQGIRRPDGEVEEDFRQPFYRVPDWVTIPEALVAQEKLQDQPAASRLDDYEVLDAMQFSNGGGVYRAEHIPTKKTVVLKEGRQAAGLDGRKRDASSRIEHESRMLQLLNDSPYTPRWIDEFTAWEHRFIAMSYIEGRTFGEVIAQEYPFARTQSTGAYVRRMSEICGAAIAGIQDIHERGVALGDLQPQNCIVSETDQGVSVSFIDLEIAGHPQRPGTGTLATPGFVDRLEDPLGHRDWFALLRMFRMALLPEGTLESFSNDKFAQMREWIRLQMGTEADTILQRILDAAAGDGFHLIDASRTNKRDLTAFPHLDPKALLNNPRPLLNGLAKFIEGAYEPSQQRFAAGDIRQVTREGGGMSVAYGGAGIVMSLSRANLLPHSVSQWVRQITKTDLSGLPLGLFNGRAGIAAVLAEQGEHDLAHQLFSEVAASFENATSTNLDSGLAGIGLGLLGAWKFYDEVLFLDAAVRSAEKLLQDEAEEGGHPALEETDATPTGLLYGWAGPALFLAALSESTGNRRHRFEAERLMDRELERGVDLKGMYLVETPDTRLMPYFSIGAAGMALPLLFLKQGHEESKWSSELQSILETCAARPCANFGLFRGTTGLVWAANLLETDNAIHRSESALDVLLSELALYLLQDGDSPVTPGDFMYRMSCDLASGASGLICALNDLQTRQASWLPVLSFGEMWQAPTS